MTDELFFIRANTRNKKRARLQLNKRQCRIIFGDNIPKLNCEHITHYKNSTIIYSRISKKEFNNFYMCQK